MADPALERIRVYFDERLLAYDTGSGFFEHPPHELLCVAEKHPENGDRVRNMHSVCLKGPIGARLLASCCCVRLTSRAAAPLLDWQTCLREATVAELAATHDTAYLESLQAASVTGKRFGASTVLPQGGWTCVALAGGAALDAADAVLNEVTRLAFCLVRPPGHHAARASCDGYCLVNNAAVAANRATAAGHRVAILDFDVHHGNGTQSIFYDRSDVLCVSLHMNHGAWDEGLPHPETGAADEVGVGPGVGFNLNVPLDFGVGDSGYMRVFDALVVPAVDEFKPTFVVVACGVDGSQMDPNGRQVLTTKGFFELGRACRKLADKHASGRIVTTLEGGYHISYAALCVHAVLAVRPFHAIVVLISRTFVFAGHRWNVVSCDTRPTCWNIPGPAVARPDQRTN